MMTRATFKNQAGNSPELFPINISKIPLKIKLLDKLVIELLNISEFIKKYKGAVATAYQPKTKIKVLLKTNYNN